MSPFGSKKDSPPIQVQVLTLDYLVEGTADFSGQNFIRFIYLTDVTMRSASGSAAPAPRGTTWAVGETMRGVIGFIGRDEAGIEKVREWGNAGKDELAADIYTGPYRVRGTLLSPVGDDAKALANLAPIVLRDAEVECLAPGSTLGSWQAPAILLYMTQVQGIMLA
ncbi:MAG TPA: hypothetical protein VH817_17220 [Thermoleophilaceae bacterium]|jgi:hypothetical protein